MSEPIQNLELNEDLENLEASVEVEVPDLNLSDEYFEEAATKGTFHANQNGELEFHVLDENGTEIPTSLLVDPSHLPGYMKAMAQLEKYGVGIWKTIDEGSGEVVATEFRKDEISGEYLSAIYMKEDKIAIAEERFKNIQLQYEKNKLEEQNASEQDISPAIDVQDGSNIYEEIFGSEESRTEVAQETETIVPEPATNRDTVELEVVKQLVMENIQEFSIELPNIEKEISTTKLEPTHFEKLNNLSAAENGISIEIPKEALRDVQEVSFTKAVSPVSIILSKEQPKILEASPINEPDPERVNSEVEAKIHKQVDIAFEKSEYKQPVTWPEEINNLPRVIYDKAPESVIDQLTKIVPEKIVTEANFTPAKIESISTPVIKRIQVEKDPYIAQIEKRVMRIAEQLPKEIKTPIERRVIKEAKVVEILNTLEQIKALRTFRSENRTRSSVQPTVTNDLDNPNTQSSPAQAIASN